MFSLCWGWHAHSYASNIKMVALIFILSLMLRGIMPAGTDWLCELYPDSLNALTTGEL